MHTHPHPLRISVVAPWLATWLLATAAAADDPPAEGAPTGYDRVGRSTKTPDSQRPAAPVTPPRVIRESQPSYPPAALEQGIEGQVLLTLVIDIEGVVRQVEVFRGAGYGLDQAAAQAARGLRFAPARRADGTPIESRIRYRYRFVLDQAPSPADASAPRPEGAVDAGELSGRIQIQSIDAPLSGATVRITGADGRERKALTGPDGTFHFTGLGPGDYRLDISAAGYASLSLTEPIAASQRKDVVYRVGAEAVAGVIEVVVQGTRPQREVTRRTITRREIERIPGTNGDAFRSLLSLPGVARPPGIVGFLLVRGSGPRDTQSFIDGVSVPITYHFAGLSSVVPTELLSAIDFYPGNFSARYGRALGGIVDAGIRSPRSDGYHGLAQLDLIDARLMLEGPIPGLEGWSFAAAGRRSYFDSWLGPVLEAAGAGVSQAPRYWDYQFMLENRASDRSKVRLSFYGSDDALEVVSSGPAADEPAVSGQVRFGTEFQRMPASFDLKLDDGDAVRGSVALGRDVLDLQLGQYFIQSETLSLFTRGEYEHKWTDEVRAIVGIDAIASFSDLNVRLPSLAADSAAEQPISSRRSEQTSDRGFVFRPAAYVEFVLDPTDRLRIVPGLRLDYDYDAGEFDVSPRLNARYRIVDEFPSTVVKGGIGLFHQPPELYELIEPLGTPGLRSNRALHYSVGLEQQITSQLELSVEGFYKRLDELVVVQPASSGLGVDYTNAGSGLAVGGEVLLKYKPDERFFGWAAYTISRSVRRADDSAPFVPVSFDQTHNLTVLGSIKLGAGWEVGARFRLISGNLTTPNVCDSTSGDCDPTRLNAVYAATTGRYAALSLGGQQSERLPLFHQLDIRVDKQWQFEDWRLSFYVDIQNVYNQQNVEGISYNYDYTARQSVTGLPILPSLGLRGEF